MAADATSVDVDVIVIGAGFVGLSVGAGLASHASTRAADSARLDGERVRIIEQGPDCGAFWRGGHESLSLHSPHHALPHDDGLSQEYQMFKTKAEVREYVTRYASAHGLDDCLSFGETVLKIEHQPEQSSLRPWRVRTSKGVHRAKRVVVATGLNRTPYMPEIPGSETRRKRSKDLTHSWSVHSPTEFVGERVLIVGSGNSAAELAVGLHKAGAASVELLVDGPRHFVRRSTMGKVFSLLPYVGLTTEGMVHELHRCTFGADMGDERVAQRWHRFQESQDLFIHLLSVELGKYGIRKPPRWNEPAHASIPPRIPTYTHSGEAGSSGGSSGGSNSRGSQPDDVVDLIQSGAIKVRAGRIVRFTSEGVVLAEGGTRHAAAAAAAAAAESGAPPAAAKEVRLAYDAIILATGFKHAMRDFLSEANGLLQRSTGEPLIDSRSRSTIIDSIYFVGMDQFKSTLSIGPVLGYRGYDVGAAIASDLYGPPPTPLRFPSLPADEQDDAKPLVSPKHALQVMGAGMAIGIASGLLSAALRRRPPTRLAAATASLGQRGGVRVR